MYTARPWTIRQYAGFSTAEDSNAFYKVRTLWLGIRLCPVATHIATIQQYKQQIERMDTNNHTHHSTTSKGASAVVGQDLRLCHMMM